MDGGKYTCEKNEDASRVYMQLKIVMGDSFVVDGEPNRGDFVLKLLFHYL